MDARKIIEGSWRLDLWEAEGQRWLAPEAHGRFILRDGVVTFMASRPAEGGRYGRYAYGRYEVSETTWSYGYEHDTMVHETTAGTRISHDLPWTGLRPFSIASSAKQLRLASRDGPYELTFDADRMFYFESGQLIRAWTRL